jgi:FlaG/FlaF family flagellin (archaellin)
VYFDTQRGLESVVAAMLLVVVAVFGVVLVYLWFTGYVGRSAGVAGQAVAAEMFKVESAFLAADGSVRLLIRIIGGVSVNVSTVYVYLDGSVIGRWFFMLILWLFV